ncbi:hypothetical protein NQ314_006221 [Rhamnusium bicolor]|uniref:PiggyBac transposable element-derived protein domain-containing protein n=1 Tax=Rhamnusium bicolor TaxID=1586634 RepID=A0AAV8Z6B7_9CUCU|nr:hypothetical protein NQ314_006221 [Rhamnusium bicolor]
MIDDVVAANVSDTEGFDEIVWGPVDGANLKTFDKNLRYTGINPNFYDFYDKDPYDIYKIFVTDEIIDYMVDQTNLDAQQIGPIRRSKTKSWVPTNHNEMETFIGILFWMGLFKLPKFRNYWSKNFFGTEALEPGSASQRVVIEMMNGLLDCGRILFTDNYYTSVALVTELLE